MKEKKSERIQDALQYLDEDLIEQVERMRQGVVEVDKNDNTRSDMQKKYFEQSEERYQDKSEQHYSSQKWKKWTTLAASVCVLLTAGRIWSTIFPQISYFDQNKEGIQESANANNGSVDKQPSDHHTVAEDQSVEDFEIDKANDDSANFQSGEKDNAYIPSNDANYQESVVEEDMLEAEPIKGIELPAMKVVLGKEDIVGDMAAFFIYEGRCYIQNEYMGNTSCVGDYVGTATGLIDEWTEQDGYVNYAGSISGDFYEVKGMNPEFMLCMVYENGIVETYVQNNGISLWKGSELINDRLHLKEQYATVSFFTSEEWDKQYETQKQPTVLSEEYRTLFDRFIDAFCEGVFELTKNITFSEHTDNNEHIYHLYFTTDDGVRLHFWMLGDGYVSFHGLNQVCVRIDEELYSEIIEVLQP